MAVQHRGSNWTADEDRRLLDLIEAGKSWAPISSELGNQFESARGNCRANQKKPNPRSEGEE
jgi:hypothetical protein